MAASIQYHFPWSFASLSSSTAHKPYLTLNILCSKSFDPFTASKLNPSIRASPMLARRVFRARGSADDNSVASPEPESDNSEAGATIDLRLPRRSLLVQFTFDLCGEKTKRLMNRLAYERGAIFVQL